jgi:hypothetical protein
MLRREFGALGELTQDVGNAGAGKTVASSVEEKRPIDAAAFIQPWLQSRNCPRPQRASPLFATLSLESHDRDRIKADVREVQIDDFLRSSTGIVEQYVECTIPSLRSWIDGLRELDDLILLKVLDLRVLEFGLRQLSDSAAPLEVFGRDGSDIAYEGLDDGKSVVSSTWAVASLLLEPFEEGADDIDIQDRSIELVRSTLLAFRSMSEEELEGVAVGQHSVAASLTLYREVLLEEVLNELLERDDGGPHESTSSRALV